jgi:hypothetical protein
MVCICNVWRVGVLAARICDHGRAYMSDMEKTICTFRRDQKPMACALAALSPEPPVFLMYQIR